MLNTTLLSIALLASLNAYQPNTGTPTFTADYKLLDFRDPTRTSSFPSRFGADVTVKGNRALIRNQSGNQQSGWMSVFEQVGGRWIQQTVLVPRGLGQDLDGDTIVIGTGGRVHVFELDLQGQWSETQLIDPPQGSTSCCQNFGENVSISGNTLIATAHRENFEDGAVYVFQRPAPGQPFAFLQRLTNPFPPAGDHYGRRMVHEGDSLYIGLRSNRFYLYEPVIADGEWALVTFRDLPFSAVHFGLSGNTFAVSDSMEAIRIFERSPTDLVLTNVIDAPTALNFGRLFDVSGDLLAVTAPEFSVIQPVGEVYLYGRDFGGPGNWGLSQVLVSPDGRTGDGFSSDVGIASDTILVGASGDSEHHSGSGSVIVFGTP